MQVIHLVGDRSCSSRFVTIATIEPAIGAANQFATFDIQSLSFFECIAVQANGFNDLVVGWHGRGRSVERNATRVA